MRYVYDKDLLRRELSIPFAALQYDLHFNEEDRCLCPFHHDENNPNLEMMVPGEDGIPWCYCRACGHSCDVLGLIARAADVNFSEAINIASALYEDQPDDVPRGPVERRAKYEVTDDWYGILRGYQDRLSQHADVGLASYAYGFFDEDAGVEIRMQFDRHLEVWGWGLDDQSNIIIPHYDRNGALTCVKVRNTSDRSWASYGGYTDLYGAWRGRSNDALLICEGESDCVWADFQEIAVDCMSLPSGAGAFSDGWVEFVRERWPEERIVLGFDNDIAGVEATTRWSHHLPGCRKIHIPESTDLRSCGLPLEMILGQSTV